MMAKERTAMKLSELVPRLPVREVIGEGEAALVDVISDSREACAGGLFVALRGFHVDGHDYIREAESKGAAAAIVERPDRDRKFPQIVVSDSRLALGIAAAEVHRHPSDALGLYGVTGTNGKTTVVHILESILEAAGIRCGLIGTLGYRWHGGGMDAPNTTPGPDLVHRLLRRMADDGVQCVAMESSSHAVALRRLVGLRYRAMALTNVTRDHLDFHGSVETYRAEKMRLFQPDGLRKDHIEVKRAVVNGDDETGRRIAAETPLETTVFGEAEGADLRAEILRAGVDGTVLRLLHHGDSVETSFPLPGAFNVSNALAAVGLALVHGLTLEEAAIGLIEAKGPAGRMEIVDRGRPFTLIIDYAHTPDGLENLLRAVRAITTGRIILLFGCGGDRDRGKRPLMGKIAADGADHVVLTDDNPRHEDPAEIRGEVQNGLRKGEATVDLVPERDEAIARAVELARAGDTVVLAGKGHEPYQITGDERRRWSEREEAEKALDAWTGGRR